MASFPTIAFVFALLASPQNQTKDPKQLIEKMVAASGGQHALHAKKDVSYRYTYIDPKGNADISIEQYVFDGELSRAEYLQTNRTMPGDKGKLVQGYDGKNTWATIDGNASTDEQILRTADFLRKTNYYWFAMMFKLQDPGLTYQYKGSKTIEGIPYDLVEISFEQGIGDVQDIYLVYINPYTNLIDQFLFTVMDFNVKDPLLMRVQYNMVDGVLLPTARRYVRANWDGEPQNQDWTMEIMTDIQFNNGLKATAFSKP